MRVNLPCLMGSCPNFLRPTCSYTECLPSFLTGSCPMEWTTASYSSCLSFDSYWPYDSARCGFPRTLTFCLYFCDMRVCAILALCILIQKYYFRSFYLSTFYSIYFNVVQYTIRMLYINFANRMNYLNNIDKLKNPHRIEILWGNKKAETLISKGFRDSWDIGDSNPGQLD